MLQCSQNVAINIPSVNQSTKYAVIIFSIFLDFGKVFYCIFNFTGSIDSLGFVNLQQQTYLNSNSKFSFDQMDMSRVSWIFNEFCLVPLQSCIFDTVVGPSIRKSFKRVSLV